MASSWMLVWIGELRQSSGLNSCWDDVLGLVESIIISSSDSGFNYYFMRLPCPECLSDISMNSCLARFRI